jgi:hypothetical protein
VGVEAPAIAMLEIVEEKELFFWLVRSLTICRPESWKISEWSREIRANLFLVLLAAGS